MTCRRDCVFGHLGTDEIPDYSDAPLTEGRIWAHLEFKRAVGDPTRVRLCPCQTAPDGDAERGRRQRKAWRFEP